MIKEVNCKVMEASAFRALLNEIYGEEVYVDFSLDGMYIDQPGDEKGPVDKEELYSKLADKLGVEAVTGLHIDDDTPVNVWITFKDRDIIRASDFVATKLWRREDIADNLWENGFEGSEEEIDAVLNSGKLKALEDCNDQDWETIGDAICSAKNSGEIKPLIHATALRRLEKAGDRIHSWNEQFDDIFVTLHQDIERHREADLWFGGEIVTIDAYSEKNGNFSAVILANGDVEASLLDAYGNELERVKDRHNGGELAGAIDRYITCDRELQMALDNASGRETGFPYTLELRFGNWFEAFDKKTGESFVLENSSNVYQAIEETLKAWSWFVESRSIDA